MTHGDEVSGIAALNEFVESLLKDSSALKYSITFAVGNIEAAKQGKRFLEKDLDRCFGSSSTCLIEERIAREYERWLAMSDYHLDIHQTVEPSISPFFVGPKCLSLQIFAQQVYENLPIICFPIGGFSNNGHPLDEYLATQKKMGLTVELGQKGFDESQIFMGKSIMENFLKRCVEDFDRNQKLDSKRTLSKITAIQNSASRDAVLRTGIQNLTPLQKGEEIGITSQGKILCPADGFALFPKYGEMAKVSSEICQIVG